jgi:hypothetical protein
MSLLTQFKLAARAQEIEVAANRSLQQFTNSFDSVLADFQQFAVDAQAAGFDADTLAEVEATKADIVTRATAALQARLDALGQL